MKLTVIKNFIILRGVQFGVIHCAYCLHTVCTYIHTCTYTYVHTYVGIHRVILFSNKLSERSHGLNHTVVATLLIAHTVAFSERITLWVVECCFAGASQMHSHTYVHTKHVYVFVVCIRMLHICIANYIHTCVSDILVYVCMYRARNGCLPSAIC